MEWSAYRLQETRLFWRSGEPPSAAPVVTLSRGASSWVPVVSGGAEVGVTEVGIDQRTLTVDADLTDFGFSDRGDAWLVVDDGAGRVDFIECRVAGPARLVSGDLQVVLAEPLRFLPTGTLSLQSAWYSWPIQADEATETLGRVTVSVAYTTRSAGEDKARVLTGVLHVVARDFETGLHVPKMLERIGSDSMQVERQSLQGHIDGARDDLLEWLYAEYGPKYPADLLDPVRLVGIHELLVWARLARRDGKIEEEQRHSDNAWSRFRRIVKKLQEDANGDGQGDAATEASDFGGGGFGPRIDNWETP